MIVLHQFTNSAMPDPSPFCAKVELYLKANELAHEVTMGNVLRAPRKKLPLIVDGGETVSDSEHILTYLNERHGIDMDSSLSSTERAQAWAFKKAIEEHLYFFLVYSRWIDERIWPIAKETFFGSLPGPLKALIPAMVRRDVRKMRYKQGTTRHSQDEIYNFARTGLKHLSALVGEEEYCFGDHLTTLDVVLFSFLIGQLLFPVETEIARAIRQHDNLVGFAERIQTQYYFQKEGVRS